jgi:hypothetical protein
LSSRNTDLNALGYLAGKTLIQADIPQDRIIDGKDIMPVLKQKRNVSPSEFLYHYCLNEVQAMRYMPSTGNIYYRIK